MKSKLKDIWDYRDMIYSLVKRELRGRYQKSVLGMLWTFLNPFFQIVIYTIVFTFIFPNSIENYYIYLMIGIRKYHCQFRYDEEDLLPKGNPDDCLCYSEICKYAAGIYSCFFIYYHIRYRNQCPCVTASGGMADRIYHRAWICIVFCQCDGILKRYGIYRRSAFNGVDLGNTDYVCI